MLIIGPTGAGKTALFQRLATGKTGSTVMSLEPNIEDRWLIRGKGSIEKIVRLVAWPGHPKLRAGLVTELAKAASIVFVVDGTDFNPKLRVIAEVRKWAIC